MSSPAIESVREDFCQAVITGLCQTAQKTLPSQYLYDDLGSALFEAITAVPEYGLTRADERLLRQYSQEIGERCRGCSVIAELGSGFGRKTCHVIEAVRPSQYVAIDVSRAALDRCRFELSRVASVPIRTIDRPYLEGLRESLAGRSPGRRTLVMFLGSSIGNFARDEAAAFLGSIRMMLRAGDAFLLGADLVKSTEQMIAAYDDPTGVTAAFNLNLLGRLNRELGADFNLRAFAHEARWNIEERRIEMHLRSLRSQRVTIPAADIVVSFEDGETIWTESCHKFTRSELADMAVKAGFQSEAQWFDEEWPFVETLWRVPK